MNLAILYWFYKDIEVTKNHLKIVKDQNPELKIYGLYGGDATETENFQTSLASLIDDFYPTAFINKDSKWKWENGDQLLVDWYKNRGNNLAWDSVVITQWDLLVFVPFRNIFRNIREDEIYFSGFRKISPLLELVWYWTTPLRNKRNSYKHFKNLICESYSYKGSLFACLFVLAVIPKSFFYRISKIEEIEIGFLEYKLPSYSMIFNYNQYVKDLGEKWFGGFLLPRNIPLFMTPLYPNPEQIPKDYILKELSKSNGFRVFHPYFELWNN